MVLYIITYATHSFGTFETLKEDLSKKSKNFIVLGWNKKWKGFHQKIEDTLEEIQKYKEDDIFVFLDGFDVSISEKFNVEELEKIYKTEYKDKILVSRDSSDAIWNYIPKFIHDYIHDKIYGGDINAGMYMGTRKVLEPFLKVVLKVLDSSRCKNDDQCSMNISAKNNTNVIIDYERKVFNNVDSNLSGKKVTAMFYGYPGTPSFSRLLRAPFEYFKFFKIEFLIIFLIIFYLFFGKTYL